MNKTQCPHCFMVYQITEDQLLQSKGNVRCGNCRERFKASVLTDSEIVRRKPITHDDNDLFAKVKAPAASDLALEERSKKARRQRAEPSLDEKKIAPLESETKTEQNKVPNEPKVEQEPDDTSDFELPDRFTHFIEEPSMGELSEPDFDEHLSEPSIDFDFATELEGDQDKDLLIDELDQMVHTKLLESAIKPIDWGTETASDDVELNTEEEDLYVQIDDESDDDFDYENLGGSDAKRKVGFAGLIGGLFLILLVGLGSVALAYQVWLMPNPSVRNNEVLQSSLNSILNPLLDYVDSFGLKLDRPNDLAGLSLVSAQSEPHPNRATTTLLRLSFLNKSSISRSLPWIELTLTNEAGAVVARRALDPADYLFNNASIDEIGPHELKKITVELLAFPKQATGFELRMLESAPE